MKRFLLCALALLCLACSSEGEQKVVGGVEPEQPAPSTGFARGADLSWTTQLESEGYKFYDKDNNPSEPFAIMRSLGMDAVRLRVWVNPEDGWCGKDDTIEKALRAKKLGLRLMVDFHYSDWWADPGKQTPPEGWDSGSVQSLSTELKRHTRDVLSSLKERGVEVEWVQVGNETSNGMLWEIGRCDASPQNYAALTSAGYESVKEIYPSAKVVVHLPNGYDLELYHWLFDLLEKHSAKYDMIGMSLYPSVDWTTKAHQCVENVSKLWQRYGKRLIICEVGMPWDSPNECYDFLSYMLQNLEASGCCEGLFYWEPEAPAGYNGGYTLGAFANNRPTHALDAFAR